MDRPRRAPMTLAILMMIWLAGPAAGQSALRPVEVMVVNQAGVAADVLAGAQAEVARIYRTVGVQVVWIPVTATGGPRCLYVSLIPERMSDSSRTPPGALGLALKGGELAYVLYDRVDRFARALGSRVDMTLGLTIAHELGHLLLRNGAHALVGLMRPSWGAADCQLAAFGRLLFTDADAKLIRARLDRDDDAGWF